MSDSDMELMDSLYLETQVDEDIFAQSATRWVVHPWTLITGSFYFMASKKTVSARIYVTPNPLTYIAPAYAMVVEANLPPGRARFAWGSIVALTPTASAVTVSNAHTALPTNEWRAAYKRKPLILSTSSYVQAINAPARWPVDALGALEMARPINGVGSAHEEMLDNMRSMVAEHAGTSALAPHNIEIAATNDYIVASLGQAEGYFIAWHGWRGAERQVLTAIISDAQVRALREALRRADAARFMEVVGRVARSLGRLR